MIKIFVPVLAFASITVNSNSYADYANGCEDPEYLDYIQGRFAYFEIKNRRLLADTLGEYERSVASSKNPYEVMNNLSRHLKLSGQFDAIDEVSAKIERIFDHADALSKEQQIVGSVFDSFSNETHSVGIARAWIAYRQGKHEEAFEELMKSIEVTGSAVLSSFGPDFAFIRQIYQDGHVAPVVEYLNSTEEFWTGKRPDGLRYVWRKMIEAECKIQFDSVDTLKALELGFRGIDVNRN